VDPKRKSKFLREEFVKVPRLFKNKLPLHFFQLESPIQIKCPQKMVVSWHTVNQFLHLSWHIPVAKNHQDTIGTGIQYPDPSARTSSEGMLLSLAIQKKAHLVEVRVPI